MKMIARLVTRGGGDENDGLIIGTRAKDNTFFKPGRVYEVLEFDGETLIKDVGPSCIAGCENGETYRDSPVGVTWASDIGHILTSAGKYLFLTMQEVINHFESESKKREDMVRGARAIIEKVAPSAKHKDL